DFLINVPVLKTHGQTKVSLGFKNLKGCLSLASRLKFHKTKRLEHCIYLLNEALRSDLTVIDGTYMLEMGPDTVLGKAWRKDLIIASRDPFACDVVGAALLGVDPSLVGHLSEFAEVHGLSPRLDSIRVEGASNIDTLREQVRWQPDVTGRLLTAAGISGLSVPYPGNTLCSRCYAALAVALIPFILENSNRRFDDTAIYCGQDLEPEADGRKAIIYGNCALKSTQPAPKTCMTVRGCPPKPTDTLLALCKALLNTRRRLTVIPKALLRLGAAGTGIHDYALPEWKRYDSPPFDKEDFRLSRKPALTDRRRVI
ncbi:MAG: DUF362 domain-containing protein, partial [Dehalococcoidia bacterium]|nr:DUF362 domain-containing protein [Dehalococcoidia bacterium]